MLNTANGRGNACYRPSKGEFSKKELQQQHAAKMQIKKERRNQDRDYVMRYREHIFANLSKNHSHYGETPSEHDKRKNSS